MSFSVMLNELSIEQQYATPQELLQAVTELLQLLSHLREEFCEIHLFYNKSLLKQRLATPSHSFFDALRHSPGVLLKTQSVMNDTWINWENDQKHHIRDAFFCNGHNVYGFGLAEGRERSDADGCDHIFLSFTGSSHQTTSLSILKNNIPKNHLNISNTHDIVCVHSELESYCPYRASSTGRLTRNKTFLRDKRRYVPIGKTSHGCPIYQNLGKPLRYYVLDWLHQGAGAHIEVYDSQYRHIGVAQPDSDQLDNSRRVPGRKLHIN